MGDLFEDRLADSLKSLRNKFSDRVKVTPDTSFIGFDAYKKVIDSGVDVVLLTTPPGFRPEQLRYAIERNKHCSRKSRWPSTAPACGTASRR